MATQRVVLAKIGLDGHDRGIKVVARALRDAGLHVIYAGLWQTPEAVVRAVADEDAGWLGLSLLSGAHMTLVPRVLELLRAAGLTHVGVVVGGIIPEADAERLLQMGVARVFGPGASLDDIAGFFQRPAEAPDAASLLPRYRAGDRRALAELLTLVSAGQGLEAIRAALPSRGPGGVIALTGSPGVGKSTLAGRLVARLRGAGRKVAVLACDPQSPRTGGALLGDRCRMPSDPDDGVLVRSIATPGGHGAIAPHLDLLIRLVAGFGFDLVLIETVGAGQGDTTVRDLADHVVLLVQPESGDDLQWEKAGIYEVADIIVVHKSDLPGADETAAHARAALDLAAPSHVPVLEVSSKTGEGLEELTQVLVAPHG